MTLYRFSVIGHGLGIDVRAESPALAWAKLRSRYPTVAVTGGPRPVPTLQADPRVPRLSDLLATESATP